MKALTTLFLFLISPLLWAQTADKVAPTPSRPQGESFTLYIDNDSRNVGGPNSDQGYSAGIRFAYAYAEDNIPSWVDELPWSSRIQKNFENASSNYGISLAHQIYTPDDTSRPGLIEEDRPYAAYLYLGFTQAYKTSSHHHLIQVDLGVIGPPAMGENVQNQFHDLIDVPRAQGWQNQLGTEPTLQASYTQKIHFFELNSKDHGRYLDIIPQGGFNVGNVLVAGHVGVMARLGLRIPNDFGPIGFSNVGGESLQDLRGGKDDYKWRIYGFWGIRGKAVAHNIFLDGNTFRYSHRVNKYPFVAETELGYAIQLGHFAYSWRIIGMSPEFKESSGVDGYASMAFSYLRTF